MSRFSKPSPALMLAFAALFVALAGGAYAATAAKNSVKTKSIKDGAVTTPKLAADAATGDKVLESSLGKVPSAATADDASKLGGQAPAKFQKFCEAGGVKGSLVISTNGFTSNTFQNVGGFNCFQPGNTTTSVQMKKFATGAYVVRFVGNSGANGTGSATCSGNALNIGVGCSGTAGGGDAPGETVFDVRVFNTITGNPVDNQFLTLLAF